MSIISNKRLGADQPNRAALPCCDVPPVNVVLQSGRVFEP